MGFGLRTVARSIRYALKVRGTSRSDYLDLLLLCHALEKGMGMRNVRRGFGKGKCDKLLSDLERLHSGGISSGYEYEEALSVVGAYLDFQEREGVDVSKLRMRAAPLLEELGRRLPGGYLMTGLEDLLEGTRIDFDSFVCSKRSIRCYSNEPVEENEFLRAVDLAKRAPSACNREPWRVYYSLDAGMCSCIADALPKQGFLGDIPYYCVVTVDRSLFTTGEVFQWFVNGGIFLAYLTLSMHYLGIGSCIFEYNLFSDSADGLRGQLGIPNNEDIIAVVGYGRYPAETKCLCAERRPTEQIAVRVRGSALAD